MILEEKYRTLFPQVVDDPKNRRKTSECTSFLLINQSHDIHLCTSKSRAPYLKGTLPTVFTLNLFSIMPSPSSVSGPIQLSPLISLALLTQALARSAVIIWSLSLFLDWFISTHASPILPYLPAIFDFDDVFVTAKVVDCVYEAHLGF